MPLAGFLRLKLALLTDHAGVEEEVALETHGLGESQRERPGVAQFKRAEERLLTVHRTSVEETAELTSAERGLDRAQQRIAEGILALESERVGKRGGTERGERGGTREVERGHGVFRRTVGT